MVKLLTRKIGPLYYNESGLTVRENYLGIAALPCYLRGSKPRAVNNVIFDIIVPSITTGTATIRHSRTKL